MNESVFQRQVKDRLKKEFPGCVVIKNDPNQIQGFPDLTIFFGSKWAMLEVKASETSSKRPNQDYWINKMSDLGYADYISPMYFDVIFQELREYFDYPRKMPLT